jgi:hypothetical protein
MVLDDPLPFAVKAWIHTKWRSKNFRTRFDRYDVQTRLEMNNVDVKKTTCPYKSLINSRARGEATCEVVLRATLVSARNHVRRESRIQRRPGQPRAQPARVAEGLDRVADHRRTGRRSARRAPVYASRNALEFWADW